MRTRDDNPIADGSPAVPARRISRIIAKPPSVMLVGVEPREEPSDLLSRPDVHVYRVRYALPARHRMRIVRPLIVVIGPRVRGVDSVLLAEAARDTRAAVIQLGPLLRGRAFGEWLDATIEEVRRWRGRPNRP
jgi:hypothetical protein